MPLKSLNFQLFGSPQLLRDGSVIRGKATQRRRLALLALLAAAPGRTLSRDRVVGLLWPERDGPQARKLLSESLYVIRRELGESVFAESSGDVLTLSDQALHCDLWEFASAAASGELETMARLSDAPFLDGVFLDEAEEFERWLDGERLRLGTERTRAVELLAAAAEREGRWMDAARQFQRLLRDDPLSSRHVLAAAAALGKAGEVPTALVLLGEFETTLRRELDVSPEPDVLALAAELRKSRPLSGGAAPIAARRSAKADLRSTAATGAPIEAAPNAGAPRGGTLRWGVLAALSVLLLAAAVWWPSETDLSSTAATPQRLAVLYFRDGSPEGDLRSVADLLTESLIEQLAGSAAFEVVPVSGVRQIRDGSLSLDSVASRFAVANVVDGSVNRRGERVVVRVRLVDAMSGAVVSTSTLERDLFDLGALEVELGRELAVSIRQRLGQEVRLTELAGETANVRARQLVARANRERDDARDLLGSARAADSAEAARGFRRADSLYQQAEIEDREWLRPAVERGWSALAASRQGSADARQAALDSALLRLDSLRARAPEDPSVLEVVAATRWARIKFFSSSPQDSTIVGITTDLERAVERDPRRARSWGTLSDIYWTRGEVVRAERAGRRALAADAYIEDAPAIYRNLFAAALYAEAVDSAAVWCTRGRTEYPADWWFHECQLTLMKYDLRGAPDPDRAWEIVAEVNALDPPARAQAAGHGYAPMYRALIAAAISARGGDQPRARQVLREIQQSAATDTAMLLDMIPEEITLLLEFGDRATAVARLRWAIERRPLLAGLVGQDPILRVLADDVTPISSGEATQGRGTAVPIP